MYLLYLCTAILLLRYGARGEHDDIDSDGILHVNNAWGLTPNAGNVMSIKSSRHPQPAPPNMLQTWRAVTQPGHSLRLICYEIDLPQGSAGKCDECSLRIEDGDDVKEYCGKQNGFVRMSATNDLHLELKTGPSGGGRINCTVEARLIGPDGQEVTEPPTTIPPPSFSPDQPFFETPTQEIDSDEHGTFTGTKRTTCDCGWANKDSARIVGGIETRVNEFPFMAGIAYRWQLNNVFCGASLITHRHAITAAHCTYGKMERGLLMSVLLGEHDYTKNTDTSFSRAINVSRTIEHQNYKRSTLDNDISILVLAESVEFNKYIGRVCLPRGQLFLDNEYVKNMGWGLTSHGGQDSTYLQKVNMRVVPMKKCSVVQGLSQDDNKHLCTYGTKKSSCQGDSGGPVVWLDSETNRYTLVGLVSYGSICGGKNPTVNTAVTAYTSWIERQIEATSQNTQTCSKQE